MWKSLWTVLELGLNETSFTGWKLSCKHYHIKIGHPCPKWNRFKKQSWHKNKAGTKTWKLVIFPLKSLSVLSYVPWKISKSENFEKQKSFEFFIRLCILVDRYHCKFWSISEDKAFAVYRNHIRFRIKWYLVWNSF